MKPQRQLVLRPRELCTRNTPSPGLSVDGFRLPAEADLYHYVRTSAIQDFAMGIFTTDFWNTHALPLGHVVGPIKHAICALAAAHRNFKYQHAVTAQAIQATETMCIVHYNQAIYHINSITNDEPIPKMCIILVCCIAFVCIENLLGRPAESLRHLQAGTEIFSSFRRRYAQGLEGQGVDNVPKLFKDIEDLLATLAMHGAIQIGHDIAPDLYFNLKPEPSVEDTQFTSLEDAANSLLSLRRDHVARMYLAKHHDTRSQFFELSRYYSMPPYFTPDVSSITMSSFRAVGYWNQRFKRLRETLHEESVPKHQRYRIQMLCLEIAVWEAFTQLRGPKDGIGLEACEKVFKEAEALIHWDSCNPAPIFAFDSNIVLAIAMLCTLSTDVGVKRRGAALLRSMRRKEGIWDSQQAADLMELALGGPVIKREKWWSVAWKPPSQPRVQEVTA